MHNFFFSYRITDYLWLRWVEDRSVSDISQHKLWQTRMQYLYSSCEIDSWPWWWDHKCWTSCGPGCGHLWQEDGTTTLVTSNNDFDLVYWHWQVILYLGSSQILFISICGYHYSVFHCHSIWWVGNNWIIFSLFHSTLSSISPRLSGTFGLYTPASSSSCSPR